MPWERQQKQQDQLERRCGVCCQRKAVEAYETLPVGMPWERQQMQQDQLERRCGVCCQRYKQFRHMRLYLWGCPGKGNRCNRTSWRRGVKSAAKGKQLKNMRLYLWGCPGKGNRCNRASWRGGVESAAKGKQLKHMRTLPVGVPWERQQMQQGQLERRCGVCCQR